MKEEKDESTKIVTFDDPLEGIKRILADDVEGEIDIISLFSTKEGKKYAQQAQEQKQFTTIGILIPLLQGLLTGIVPKLPELFSDEKMRSVWMEKVEETNGLDPKEKDFFLGVPDMLNLVFQSSIEGEEPSSETDIMSYWGEKAAERYLGGMVLAIHSYAEAYLDSIVDRLIQNDDLRPRVLKYCDKDGKRGNLTLMELDAVAGSKLEVISELAKKAFPWKLSERMWNICKSLDCLGDLVGYTKRVDGKLLEEFKYFCERRNCISHGEPAPDLEEYGLKLDVLDWNEMKDALSDELSKAWPDAPQSLYALIEIGCEWGRESSAAEYFALLERLFKMAVLFPATFDYYVNQAHTKFEATKESRQLI
jgi:hypothetical protein